MTAYDDWNEDDDGEWEDHDWQELADCLNYHAYNREPSKVLRDWNDDHRDFVWHRLSPECQSIIDAAVIQDSKMRTIVMTSRVSGRKRPRRSTSKGFGR